MIRKVSSPLYTLILFALCFSLSSALPAAAAPISPGSDQIAAVSEADVTASMKRPRDVSSPGVSLDLPSSVMIGEDFTFTVTFDNTGADPGYGPFIDLYIPSIGADGDDGILLPDPATATYLGESLTVTVLTFPANGRVRHPYAVNSSGAFIEVIGNPGDKLMVIQLPFGSFTADQPVLDVTVAASVSELADLGTPLTIRARAGFQFGNTPLNDWCCGDVTMLSNASPDGRTWPGSPLTPAVITITKIHDGEDGSETATGPNFERTFTVSVDIADGQVIEGLILTDLIDDNLVITAIGNFAYAVGSPAAPLIDVGGGASLPYGPVNPPANSLTIGWVDDLASLTTLTPITGGPGADDITFDISFYVPEFNASGSAIIDPATADDAIEPLSMTDNAISGSFIWVPIDPRDSSTSLAATGECPNCALADKSIAVQKTVAVIGGGEAVPGAALEWTIDFQVSDYFAFDGLVLTDLLSDGQIVDVTFTPTLTIGENGASATESFTWGASGTPGASASGNVLFDNAVRDADGAITILFNVSDQMEDATDGSSRTGQVVGGLVPDNDGSANDGPTTGRIVFRSVVLQEYDLIHTLPGSSGNASLNQGDTVANDVVISGGVLDVTSCNVLNNPPCASLTGSSETDDGGASASVPLSNPSKVIYARDGALISPIPPAPPIEIAPGDSISYRIQYELLIGDFEELTLTEFLPLPVFFADDPDNTGSSGHTWTEYTGADPVPPVGEWMFGPDNTYDDLTGEPAPVVTTDPANNLIQWQFGTHDEEPSRAVLVDLIFTIEASNEPFADQLYLSNMVQQSDQNTLTTASSAEAIARVILTQPVMLTRKGVVSYQSATSSPVYSTNPPASMPDGTAIVFAPSGTDGTPPAWSPVPITDADEVPFLDANISSVEGDDLITFGVLLYNSGSSVKGAFDVRLYDVLQPQYAIPDPANGLRFQHGLNLQIAYGDGTVIPHDATGAGTTPFTWIGLGGTPGYACGSTSPDPCGPDGVGNTADDFFGAGVELVDDNSAPVEDGYIGVCQAHSVGPGKNIIIVTYDLHIRPGVAPNTTIQNTVTLFNYANEEGGPDHTSPEDQPREGFTDSADVRIARGGDKDVTPDAVTVGDTYSVQLTVSIPAYTTAYVFDDGMIRLRDRLENGIFAIVGSEQLVSSTNCSNTALDAASTFWTGHTVENVNPSPDTGTDVLYNFPGPIDNSAGATSCGFVVTIDVMVANQDMFNDGYYWLPPTDPGITSNDTARLEFRTETGQTNDYEVGSASVDVDQPYLVTTKSTPIVFQSDGVTPRSPAEPRRGDIIVYRLGTTNQGETTAYEVVLDDFMPEYVEYVTGSAFIDANNNDAFDAGELLVVPVLTGDVLSGGQWLSFSFPSLNAGESIGPIVFRGLVRQEMPLGFVMNNIADADWSTKEGTGPGTGLDNPDEREYLDQPALTDDSINGGTGDEDSAELTGINLTIDKGFNPALITVGDTSVLTFTLTNPNTQTDLTNITFSDTLAPGIAIAASPNVTTSADCDTSVAAITADAGGSLISITGLRIAAAVDAATPRTCTITVDIVGNIANVYDNVTTPVSSDETGPGPSASDVIVVGDTLAMYKAFDPEEIMTGETSTLTFTLMNPHTAAVYPGGLTNVGFIDPLPAGLVIVSGPEPADAVCGGTLTALPDTAEIILEAAELAPAPEPMASSGGHICQFEVVVRGRRAGDWLNTPTYLGSEETGESTLYNSAPIVVNQRPEIFIFDPGFTKAGDPAFAVIGETITWVVTVRNPSDMPYPDAVVSDTIDPQFQVTGATTSKGQVTVTGQTVRVVIGVLNPGEEVTIQIQTLVASGPPGDACNEAEIRSDLANQTITTRGCVQVFADELPDTGGRPPFALASGLIIAGLLGVGMMAFLWVRSRKSRYI